MLSLCSVITPPPIKFCTDHFKTMLLLDLTGFLLTQVCGYVYTYSTVQTNIYTSQRNTIQLAVAVYGNIHSPLQPHFHTILHFKQIQNTVHSSSSSSPIAHTILCSFLESYSNTTLKDSCSVNSTDWSQTEKLQTFRSESPLMHSVTDMPYRVGSHFELIACTLNFRNKHKNKYKMYQQINHRVFLTDSHTTTLMLKSCLVKIYTKQFNWCKTDQTN